jgi:beta-xylosidase
MAQPSLHHDHRNPVHDGYFADPFVWSAAGEYFAVGTGPGEAAGTAPSERVFPLLRSRDLVHWRNAGSALVRPPAELGDTYWAPEVAFADGAYHLYYSVGRADVGHQLRVARSVAPEGPYVDTGAPLLDPSKVPFAIDPHAFRDDDGRWYLFYACDFLDHGECPPFGAVRAGTALMVAPLDGMTRLAGAGTVVLRARHDWQRFLADRPMYGGRYDWHTLEGPCVVKHAGRYYCFYSGGRWETDTYGVDYGVADHVLGPYSDEGNERGPRVLRTIPGRVIGPGHNSVVVGPDGVTEHIVYHAWDAAMTARRMWIDPLAWTADGPRCGRREPTPG